MAFALRNCTPHTGAEVSGIDLSKPVSEEDRIGLNHALADRGMLVFHDQHFDAPGFAESLQVFGELMKQQADRFCLPELPIVGFISNRDTDEPGGKVIVRGEQFHTDHSNYPEPPKATILYGISIPSSGGDTQFVNVQAAYDDLPAALRAKIDPLRCLHIRESSRSPRKMAKVSAEAAAKAAQALHPLVTRHPITGRKGLYLNTGRMESIPGMADDEAHRLIAELQAHATQATSEYRHSWRKNDVVIWDNRTVLHQANGDCPPEELRYLYRLMIKGSPMLAAA